MTKNGVEKVLEMIATLIQASGYIVAVGVFGFLGLRDFIPALEHFLRYDVWKDKSVLEWLSDANREVLVTEWKGLYSFLEQFPTFFAYWFIGLFIYYFWRKLWEE